MGNNNVKIKYPKQHPILRNMFACFMTIVFIVPLLVTLIGFGVKKVNNQENIKTETTIGEILHYYVDTDRNGNANYYTTEVSYNIDGIQYSKNIKTRYYVADAGNKVVLYYAKGNPFSVVFTVQEYDFGIEMKIKTFMTLSGLFIALFIYKAYSDAERYSNQLAMMHNGMISMNNGMGTQYPQQMNNNNAIGMNNGFGNGMNNGGNNMY